MEKTTEKIVPYLVEKPWAGTFLSKLYQSGNKPIGEAWLLSTIKEGESNVGAQKLSSFLGGPLPYVVKIIDAKESLSIQVHPNDEWAAQLENSKGKTECWLILDSEPGAGVYLGLKKGIEPADFRQALEKNEAVDSLLEFFPVHRGDFITVPAGTIHAIGGGVTLLEVQQASGITYRLWDWGRPGRELHIEKGLKVSNFESKFEIRRDLFSSEKSQPLMQHKDFRCYLNESHGDGWFINLKTYETFKSAPGNAQSPPDQFVFVC